MNGIIILFGLAIFLSGCVSEKYYTANGDECKRVAYWIFYDDTQCTKGERLIKVETDEKKNITIKDHTNEPLQPPR